MANLANLTYFAATNLHSIDKEGADLILVCVAGRFHLPRPGGPFADKLRLCDEQPPPPVADVYWGEPGKSSLRYEGQSAYHRPATDIYLNGHARPPMGRPVREMRVRLQVGELVKEVQVFGNRVWRGGLLGLTPSNPEPFEAMPLRYEHSFGGNLPKTDTHPAAWEPRNPVGRGFYRDAVEASGKPLPNLEDPKQLIRRWSDRPPPAGFGPVARSWQPRLKLGGTADQKWVEERCPLWPLDMDVRFFQAAAAGMVAEPYLRGGEPVLVEGVSPDGPIRFAVPERRLLLKSSFKHKVEYRLLVLDGVLIEPDEGAVTFFWRGTVDVSRRMHLHEYCVVRELEPWEEVPG